MVELLIIADDFTGALDTGIQFAKKGIETQVVADTKIEDIAISDTAQVLVIDLETRPLTRGAAYSAVEEITRWAIMNKIETIYKKTDSALRGNIGAELKAVVDMAQHNLYFIPAFPEMNRITVCGVHYIEGTPLHESMFGKDPFEPVKFSYIPDIIEAEEEASVCCIGRDEAVRDCLEQYKVGIIVFDAQTDRDIRKRAEELKTCNQLKFLAGCAGFASVLPEVLGLKGGGGKSYKKKKGMYVACGSLNPITKKQIEFATRRGFIEIKLTSEQKLNPEYYETKEGHQFLEAMEQICKENPRIIVDTFDQNSRDTIKFAEKMGMCRSDIRFSIARCHGIILKYLLDRGMDYTLFMTGGDTLMGFMKSLEKPELSPICEISQGVVLSKLKWNGKEQQVISKSGGFGQEDVLVETADKLILKGEGEVYEVCNDSGSMP